MTTALPARACGIDFGTSNSTVGWQRPGRETLIPLEDGRTTLPSVLFFNFEERRPVFGRHALHEYLEGYEGRLMRSLKSLLGSRLLKSETTVLGSALPFKEILKLFLGELKRRAEAEAGRPFEEAVLGRPVFFVDDDSVRDRQAQSALEGAARSVGFDEVHFQYEPIAAAFDHERQIDHEEIVLVADIGGGTSDFSVVRVGPQRAVRLDRQGDILANHGVHVAGTDFDRRVELASILPAFGYGAMGPSIAGAPAREVPSGIYFDLATWHLINTVYSPQRVAEARQMRVNYADPVHHQRLMTVLTERLGHELAARAEQAKIEVSGGGEADIDLSHVESRLGLRLAERDAVGAIEGDIVRIVDAARATVAQAGLRADGIDALYFTGGSTGMRLLAQRIAAAFPRARAVRGDRFASVATGLGLHAQRVFGAA